jgi:hypothetical protein
MVPYTFVNLMSAPLRIQNPVLDPDSLGSADADLIGSADPDLIGSADPDPDFETRMNISERKQIDTSTR